MICTPMFMMGIAEMWIVDCLGSFEPGGRAINGVP